MCTKTLVWPHLVTIIVVVSPMGTGMGIPAVRGVPEKVESWREWGRRGECVALPSFGDCPETWLLLSVTLVDLFYRVNENRSGWRWVDFSREESGASHRETHRAEHQRPSGRVGAGSSHRAQCC